MGWVRVGCHLEGGLMAGREGSMAKWVGVKVVW